jgi:hypothetical protein
MLCLCDSVWWQVCDIRGGTPEAKRRGECWSKDPSQANTYTSFIPLEYYTLFNYICVYYIYACILSWISLPLFSSELC